MGDGGVDGVLGDVAFGAGVVVAIAVFGQCPPLHLHLVPRLPGAEDDLTNAPHCLGVGRDDAERPQVMQDILGGDGFPADAGFGERHIFGDAPIQVVAHHQHVQVLFQGVDGVGAGGVGGGGQHVQLAAHPDDVGGVPTACAFGVVGVDAAIFEGGDGVFHKACFVQGISVDGDLNIIVFGNVEAGVDRRWGGAPVFVQLQPDRPSFYLLIQPRLQTTIAFTHKAQVHREGFGGFQHPVDVPGSGGAGGGVGASGGSGAATNHGGNARGDRHLNLLGTNEVDVGINAASGEDHAFSGDRLGTRSHNNRHIILDVRVARFADRRNLAVLNPYIRFDNAPPVQNQRVGDHQIHRSIGAGDGRLPHAIADYLAAAKLHLVAIGGVVLLHLDNQLGVCQSDAIAHRWSKSVGIGASIHAIAHRFLSLPVVMLRGAFPQILSVSGAANGAVDNQTEAYQGVRTMRSIFREI